MAAPTAGVEVLAGVGVADAVSSAEVVSTEVVFFEEVEVLVETAVVVPLTAVVVPLEMIGPEPTGVATEEVLTEAGTTGDGVVVGEPEAGVSGTGVTAVDSSLAVLGTATLETPGVMVAEKRYEHAYQLENGYDMVTSASRDGDSASLGLGTGNNHDRGRRLADDRSLGRRAVGGNGHGDSLFI